MPQSRGPVLLALYDGLETVGDIANRTGLSEVTVRSTLVELKSMKVVRSELALAATRWYLTRTEPR